MFRCFFFAKLTEKNTATSSKAYKKMETQNPRNVNHWCTNAPHKCSRLQNGWETVTKNGWENSSEKWLGKWLGWKMAGKQFWLHFHCDPMIRIKVMIIDLVLILKTLWVCSFLTEVQQDPEIRHQVMTCWNRDRHESDRLFFSFFIITDPSWVFHDNALRGEGKKRKIRQRLALCRVQRSYQTSWTYWPGWQFASAALMSKRTKMNPTHGDAHANPTPACVYKPALTCSREEGAVGSRVPSGASVMNWTSVSESTKLSVPFARMMA